jgi:type II secretory pathway pseudopilin PulG
MFHDVPFSAGTLCILHSDFCISSRSDFCISSRSDFCISSRRGYTLVELFITLGILAIVLGLMINLANRVRRESTDQVTRQVLARLTVLMEQYQKRYDGLPPVQPLVEGAKPPGEPALALLARQNNADFVRYLHLTGVAKGPAAGDDPLAESFGRSPTDAGVLEDPWGSPIVFMPRQHPAIGMAPNDTFFFFSAGPDRLFLTREDNVYSYEGNGINAEVRSETNAEVRTQNAE